jgi:small neutral amino acid transporter SnatA (MarC family)
MAHQWLSRDSIGVRSRQPERRCSIQRCADATSGGAGAGAGDLGEMPGRRHPVTDEPQPVASIHRRAVAPCGAWFIDGETRMDDQQHVLSALVRTMSIADADGAEGVGARGDAPSAWLWIFALVAALNPARVALGVPSPSGREAERRRERAVVAGIGAAVGSVVLLIAAAFSDALLDAFYVSAPAFRIAAGIVGAAAGVYAMFVHHRSNQSHLPALPGRRAALVPVAVPLVINAAAFLLTISAAADRGLPVVVVAIVAGGVLAVAATLAPADGVADRFLELGARATGGLLLLAGVLLVIDGVLSV